MFLSESAEEVLEALWIVWEEGGNKCVKISSLKIVPDSSVLGELLDARILKKCGDDMFELTDDGIKQAGNAIRRHRLAERLLTDVLDVKKELIHDTACQFEHHLHKGIDNNVCTLLGHPKICPHGKQIPPGACCAEGTRVVGQLVAPLSELKPGQGGQVAYLHTTDPKRAQMLISMGIVPGVEINLLAGFPSYLFQISEGQFAVDRELAVQIYVRCKTV